MKIICEDKVYIQKKDILSIKEFCIYVPNKIIFDELNLRSYFNKINKYDFVCYESEEEIEFIKSLDWVLDYEEFKNLSFKKLIKVCHKLSKEEDKVFKEFYSMSIKDRKENKHMILECKMLNYKKNSIIDLLQKKKEENELNIYKQLEKKEDNKVKKILLNIKNR